MGGFAPTQGQCRTPFFVLHCLKKAVDAAVESEISS